MAAAWGEARRMVEACDAHGVTLTIGHQRRYGPAFVKAKELLDSGAIGQLVRMEGYSYNLYDWAIHWFDVMFFYNDDQPADWVMGQIDARGGRTVFGMPVEGQGLCYMHWPNGVYGLMVTGKNIMQPVPCGADDRRTVCNNRLIGAAGMIEVGIEGGGPGVRLLNAQTGGQWQTIEQAGIDAPETIANVMRGVLDGVLTGAPVKVDAHNTLRGTEAMFAAYESSRRRQRIDLPLTIDDNPLETMLAEGMVAIETPPAPPQLAVYKL
jgi:predicted dehydrogenase